MIEDRSRWILGNRFELLENGEAFFPAVFDAIRAAERELFVEALILFDNEAGQELQQALVAAARRGVSVDLLVDGFGSSELTTRFVAELTEAGVRLRVFDPGKPWFGVRTKVLRCMHRKIVVGINYSADHLADFGPEAKQHYAAAARGLVVGEIHRDVRDAIAASTRG